MRISGVESLQQKFRSHIVPPSTALDFSQVRSELRPSGAKGSLFFGADSFGELRKVEQMILTGAEISPQQMLLIQLRAVDVHMRVEFLSKIAESAIATAKRLQNPQ